MALINDSQLSALAEDIVPDAPEGASEEQVEARNNSVATTKDLCQKICQYLIDQMEVGHSGKKITVDLDSGGRTIESFTGGVGSNGGSLNSAVPSPVSGSVNDSKDSTSTQTNEGKGLIK